MRSGDESRIASFVVTEELSGGVEFDGGNLSQPAPLPSLSLVIPAYNEATRIARTLRSAAAFLASAGYMSEIIVVDDGSSDRTAELARSIVNDYPTIRVLSIVHGGKAAALRAGMVAATCDLIVFSDADLATPLTYLDVFRQAIDAGNEIVIGSREGTGAERIDEPRYRHLMGRVFNGLVRILVLPGINDTQCGFKMFRREVAHEILKRARLYREARGPVKGPRVTAFDVELLVVARRLGYRITSIPVVWTYGTQSKVNPIRDTLHNFGDILRVKWNELRGSYR